MTWWTSWRGSRPVVTKFSALPFVIEVNEMVDLEKLSPGCSPRQDAVLLEMYRHPEHPVPGRQRI